MGRLTRDPEIRYSSAAEPMCIARYSLAINRQFKRDGEPDADFITCVAFAKKGEFAEKYFRKGQMVAICGHLQVRNWEDQEGNKRVTTEVVIDDQYFAESKASFESRTNNTSPDNVKKPPKKPTKATSKTKNSKSTGIDDMLETEIDVDDLPF